MGNLKKILTLKKVKKEILISIIIGFGIGLIATFGIYSVRKSKQTIDKFITPIAQDQGPSNIPENPNRDSLSLVSPIDESISKESKTKIIGNTWPTALVTVLTEKGEKVIQADKDGNFETEISLISGENEIEVISFSQTGEKASKIITVVYSTAEI